MNELYTLVIRGDLLRIRSQRSLPSARERNAYSFKIALYISDISASRTTWILARLLDHIVDQALSVEHTLAHDLEADDVGAFLEDVRRGGRHRTRKDATDICMMTTRRSEEYDLLCLVVEYRTDHSNIWEMSIGSMSLYVLMWTESSLTSHLHVESSSLTRHQV